MVFNQNGLQISICSIVKATGISFDCILKNRTSDTLYLSASSNFGCVFDSSVLCDLGDYAICLQIIMEGCRYLH